MQNLLQNNPLATIAVSVVVLLASLGFVIAQLGSASQQPTAVGQVYFFDQNKQELFPVPAPTIPPIETDSGPYQGMPAGVRAHVFMRGQDDWFIGYLETTFESIPAAHRPLDSDSKYVIRGVEGDEWAVPGSIEADRILSNVRDQGLVGRNAVKVVLPVTTE